MVVTCRCYGNEGTIRKQYLILTSNVWAEILNMSDCITGGAHSSQMKTSDLYWTYNLPKRFDNPSKLIMNLLLSCLSTCQHLLAYEFIFCFFFPAWFSGYGVQTECQNPMYRRTSQDYGWLPPNVHTVPVVYRPQDASFSKTYAQFGMYRNYSLNATPNVNSTIPWTRGAAASRRTPSTYVAIYKMPTW